MTKEEIENSFKSGNQVVIDTNITLLDPFGDESKEEIFDVSLEVSEFRISRLGDTTIKPVYNLTFDLPTKRMYTLLNTPNIIVFVNIYSNRKVSEFQEIRINPDLDIATDRKLILKPFNLQSVNFDKYMENELDINEIEESSKTRLPITLELFEVEQFKADKRLLNFSLRNVSPLGAIKYLVKYSDIKLNGLAISKVSNTEIYEEIFIPPLNLFEAISYIINTYGLHKNGTKLYYEDSSLFIIEKAKKISFIEQPEKSENFLVNVLFKTIDSPMNQGDDFSKNGIDFFGSYQINNNADAVLRVAGANILQFNESEKEAGIFIERNLNDDYNLMSLRKLSSIPKQTYFANYKVNNGTLVDKNYVGAVSKSATVDLKFDNSHLCNHNFATYYNFNFSVKQDMMYNGLWKCNTSMFIFTKSTYGFSQTFVGNFSKIIL